MLIISASQRFMNVRRKSKPSNKGDNKMSNNILILKMKRKDSFIVVLEHYHQFYFQIAIKSQNDEL